MSKKQKLCSICHQASVKQKHDVLNSYICPACEAQKSYSTSNKLTKGKICQFPSFALEFEIAAEEAMRRRALILLQYQFERTYDSTVSDEYKSPIYNSLRSFRKPLTVLHDLRDLVNERCGTHLHVSFQYKHMLYLVRQEVFGPLIAHLIAHEEQTIVFWGRTFSDQAQATLHDGERHVCFNTWSRHNTIEYRLPRFRSAEQYLTVVQFCRSTTAFLESRFNLSHEGHTPSKILTPEQMGNQLLARYKKSCERLEAAPTFSNSPTLHSIERISHV